MPIPTYTFDANGNQTGAGSTTFTYDRADQLRTATIGATTGQYPGSDPRPTTSSSYTVSSQRPSPAFHVQ